MYEIDGNELSHLLNIAKWLHDAIGTGNVAGVSVVVVDTSDPVAVPRHVFFATVAAVPLLAGGLLVAQHDLASRLLAPAAPPPGFRPAQPAPQPAPTAPAGGPHGEYVGPILRPEGVTETPSSEFTTEDYDPAKDPDLPRRH